MNDKPGKRIFLHGFLGDVSDFDFLTEIWPGSTALPLPGHGGEILGSSSTTGGVLEKLAEQITEAAGGQTYTLVGYSMGGRLAAWLTSLDLIEPKCLVLIASSLGIVDSREREARLQSDLKVSARLRDGNFGGFLDQWYGQPLFGRLKKSEKYQKLRDRRLQGDSVQMARALELLGSGCQPDLTGFKFRQNVMYIAGKEDKKYSEIASCLTGFRTAIIENAAHAVHLEQPAEVVRLIKEMETSQ